MVIDLQHGKSEIKKINGISYGFFDLLLLEEACWLVALQQAALVNYNIVDPTAKEYPINLELSPTDALGPFQKIVKLRNSLYLVPSNSLQMVEFNLSSHQFTYVEDFCATGVLDSALTERIEHPYLYVSSNSTTKIYVSRSKDSQFIEYDPINHALRQEKLRVSDAWNGLGDYLMENQDVDRKKASACALIEHIYTFLLKSLIDWITQPAPKPWLDKLLDKQVELRRAEIAHPDGKAGVEIYDKSKRTVWKS